MQADEYNDFPSLLLRYKNALARLESLGVRVSASSRLRKYASRLETAIDDPRPAVEEEFIFAMAFALREVDEIIELVEHLPRTLDPATLRLLRDVHRGAEHPDDDDASSSARESQYELYLGAVLRRAGLPARHGSPDLVAEYNGRDHYIEAKRPSSAQRVDDRIRSAVHQLRRLSRPGIIALSLDQVLRPPRSILSAPALWALAPEVARRVQQHVVENLPMWKARLRNEPVDAVLLTTRVPGRLESTGHLVLGSSLHIEMISAEDTESSSASFIRHAAQAYLAAQRPHEIGVLPRFDGA